MTLVLLAPIWIVDYPPLVDLPNHINRAHIIRHLADTPFYARYCEVTYWPLANMGLDLLAVPLLYATGPIETMRLILSMLVCGFAWACHSLARAIHGRISWLAIPAVFLLYNGMFFYGFISFHLGLTAAMISLVFWLRYRERWTASRLVWVGLLTFLTYLCHLSAYSFLCAAYTVLHAYPYLTAPEHRRQLPASLFSVSLVPLIPGALAYLAARVATGSSESAAAIWAGGYEKLAHAMVAFRGYFFTVDAAVLAGLAIVAVWVWRKGRVNCNRPVVALAAAFAVLFAIFPSMALGGGDVDTRYIVPALLFGLLGLSIDMPGRQAAVALAAVLALLTVRVASVGVAWRAGEPALREQIELVMAVEPQSRLMAIVWMPDDNALAKRERPIYTADFYAGLFRGALAANLFAFRGQHQLACSVSPIERLQWKSDWPADSIDWPALFRDYDYIWTYRAGDAYLDRFGRSCDVAARRGHGTLFKVRRPGIRPCKNLGPFC